jgi:hypothetical protein
MHIFGEWQEIDDFYQVFVSLFVLKKRIGIAGLCGQFPFH